MALETRTFDFNATFFPLGLDFHAAFEDSPFGPLDAPGQYSTSESLNVAKKALDEEDEDDDEEDEEEDDKEDEDEFEDDDEEEDEVEDDDDEYEDDDEEDDDEEEDDDDDDEDVDELQVGRRR